MSQCLEAEQKTSVHTQPHGISSHYATSGSGSAKYDKKKERKNTNKAPKPRKQSKPEAT